MPPPISRRSSIDRFGIEKGDRVAIVMRNFPEWSIAFWAAAAAGAIVVPLNAWWTADELEYGLQDSGSKVVFVDAERLDRLTDVLPKLDLRTVVVRVRCRRHARRTLGRRAR